MTNQDEELTYEQVLKVAYNSSSRSVRDALKKLEFIIKLKHTQEEIDQLIGKVPSYDIRIGLPELSEAGATYRYVTLDVTGRFIRVCYDQQEIAGNLSTNKENIFYMGSLR